MRGLRDNVFRRSRVQEDAAPERNGAPPGHVDEAMLPEPRSHRAIVWSRFKRDRAALASGVFVVALFAVLFIGEPIAVWLLGHGPNDLFPMSVDADKNLLPAGPWSHVPAIHGVAPVTPEMPRTLFVLGADGTLGRDLFLRVLDGGRSSLEIALGATVLALTLGTFLGLLSGYFGGWLDAGVSRLTEFIMGFPILLFFIAFGWTLAERLDHVTLRDTVAPGLVSFVLVIGVFYCFYPARLVRAQVLVLRRQEFVEAARMIGASDWRILRKHILPHVSGSLIVYGTQLMAITIFLEAALSILGLGLDLPAASWGSIIATHYGTLFTPSDASFIDHRLLRAEYLITLWPSLLLFFTVVSFTLLGEGVRNAFEPRSVRA